MDVQHSPPDEIDDDSELTEGDLYDAVGFGRERDRVLARYVVRVPEWVVDRLSAHHDDAGVRAAKNVALQRFETKHDYGVGGTELTAEQLRGPTGDRPAAYEVWIDAE